LYLAIGSSTLFPSQEYTEPYIFTRISPYFSTVSTVWLSGGRRGGTRGVEQLNYRAACLRAAQAARPLELVLGGDRIDRRLFDLEVMKRLLATVP
jgi:hypothetical protein